MTNKPPRISVADIDFTDEMLAARPQAEPATMRNTFSSTEETNAIFARLRQLKASFGRKPDKDKLAVALIRACITEGLDVRPRIVGALKRFELKEKHIEDILNRFEGEDPSCHKWSRLGTGHYRLLDPA